MKHPFPKMTDAISMIVLVLMAAPALARPMSDEDSVKEAYKAYVQAWKTKDLSALQKLIADDYMAVNSQGEMSTKEIELGFAKTDRAYDEMAVDDIHSRVWGNTAIVTGLISAQGKSTDGQAFAARVRFLAALVKRHGAWQLVATESAAVRPAPRKD